MADTEPDVTISVTIPAWEAERLSALVSEEEGLPDLTAVITTLLDHVQQGVYRPGAWEREWLMQVFGEGFLTRVETDPDSPSFDRVKRGTDG